MQVTVGDTIKPLSIRAGCSFLHIANTGSETVFYGFEPDVTASAGASQGVPIAAGKEIALGGHGVPLSNRTLSFICASGLSTTLNYTQG